MTISGFALLAFAIPVLLFGEYLVRRIKLLRDFHIPPPVISGLLVAVVILVLNETGLFPVQVQAKVYDAWWSWLVMPEATWQQVTAAKGMNVYQPLLIAFFTCIGLNASWGLVRKGGKPMLVYLLLATGFVFVQNGLGVFLARLLNENPLLGLHCGGIALMGGFGTATSFSPVLQENGLQNAAVIGIVAAAFGVIAGSLVGGPTGRLLVERRVKPNLQKQIRNDMASPDMPQVLHDAAEVEHEIEHEEGDTFFKEIRTLLRNWPALLLHLATLIVAIKGGAWLYYSVDGHSVLMNLPVVGEYKFVFTFPVYIGAMVVAMIIRNIHDALGGKLLDSEVVDRIASVCLTWLLAAVMVELQLDTIVHSAWPMFIILAVQIVVMLLFVYYVVFVLMGRDYEAATMSVGMIGFGLGATSNAVATMKQMTRAYGPAPRAFLIVTVVGAFLIDFTNSIVIAGFISVLKPAAMTANAVVP